MRPLRTSILLRGGGNIIWRTLGFFNCGKRGIFFFAHRERMVRRRGGEGGEGLGGGINSGERVFMKARSEKSFPDRGKNFPRPYEEMRKVRHPSGKGGKSSGEKEKEKSSPRPRTNTPGLFGERRFLLPDGKEGVALLVETLPRSVAVFNRRVGVV